MSTIWLFLIVTSTTTTYNVSFRFVDRDMYMRYAGNGIGHYKVDLADDARTAAPSTDIEDEAGEGLEGAMAEDLPPHAPMTNDGDSHGDHEGTSHEADKDEEDEDEGEENEDKDSDVEEREDEEEEDVDDSESEDDFGAEDREGGFVDLEDEEGYAPL